MNHEQALAFRLEHQTDSHKHRPKYIRLQGSKFAFSAGYHKVISAYGRGRNERESLPKAPKYTKELKQAAYDTGVEVGKKLIAEFELMCLLDRGVK